MCGVWVCVEVTIHVLSQCGFALLCERLCVGVLGLEGDCRRNPQSCLYPLPKAAARPFFAL